MTASRPDQHSNGSTLSDERPEYTGADAFEWSAQTGAATSEATLDDPDPQQTTVIEQCVAWGGELRVRVQITLACAGEHDSACACVHFSEAGSKKRMGLYYSKLTRREHVHMPTMGLRRTSCAMKTRSY